MPDLNLYKGREQGFVKHVLIEKYLGDFAYKIASAWEEIIYIDAFAGPWQTQSDDYSDTSFCIALKSLRQSIEAVRMQSKKNIRLRAFLIEKDPKAFEKLREFGELQQRAGFEITCYQGPFEEQVEEVYTAIKQTNFSRPFTFALIDPKGWTGLSMAVIAPLVGHRSSEILVNVMSSFIHRFVDAEGCQDSYDQFFGRKGVREVIRNTPREDRQDAVVREYCRSLRIFCNFKYVSSCIILDPEKKAVKYFMVFATNHSMGIKVFKEAEMHAASIQDDLKENQRGQPELSLGMDPLPSAYLREKYRKTAYVRVEEHLRRYPDSSYCDVFCKAMAVPLVTERELLQYLKNHPNIKLSLNGMSRRKPKITEGKDRVLWQLVGNNN